jgi:hypothetical protein
MVLTRNQLHRGKYYPFRRISTTLNRAALGERIFADQPAELGVGFNGNSPVLTAVFLDVQLTLCKSRTVHVAQQAGEFLVVPTNASTVLGQVADHLVA